MLQSGVSDRSHGAALSVGRVERGHGGVGLSLSDPTLPYTGLGDMQIVPSCCQMHGKGGDEEGTEGRRDGGRDLIGLEVVVLAS